MPTATTDTFLDYLVAHGRDNERFDFDTPDEAYQFGNRLRAIVESENSFTGVDHITVDISNTVVRVKLARR